MEFTEIDAGRSVTRHGGAEARRIFFFPDNNFSVSPCLRPSTPAQDAPSKVEGRGESSVFSSLPSVISSPPQRKLLDTELRKYGCRQFVERRRRLAQRPVRQYIRHRFVIMSDRRSRRRYCRRSRQAECHRSPTGPPPARPFRRSPQSNRARDRNSPRPNRRPRGGTPW